jgi:hypothetical protein
LAANCRSGRGARRADQFLAGEAVTIDHVSDELSARVVKGEREEAGLWRDPANCDVATAVERPVGIIGSRHEGNAVAERELQFAPAFDLCARIGVDLGGANFRSRGPGADREPFNRHAATDSEPRRADADRCRDDKTQQ